MKRAFKIIGFLIMFIFYSCLGYEEMRIHINMKTNILRVEYYNVFSDGEDEEAQRNDYNDLITDMIETIKKDAEKKEYKDKIKFLNVRMVNKAGKLSVICRYKLLGSNPEIPFFFDNRFSNIDILGEKKIAFLLDDTEIYKSSNGLLSVLDGKQYILWDSNMRVFNIYLNSGMLNDQTRYHSLLPFWKETRKNKKAN